MRFLVMARFPVEGGNAMVKNPEFGQKINEILTKQKAEGACFTLYHGQRMCVYTVNLSEISQLPSVAEPWWLFGKADVELLPAMVAEDFGKAQADIVDAVKRYG